MDRKIKILMSVLLFLSFFNFSCEKYVKKKLQFKKDNRVTRRKIKSSRIPVIVTKAKRGNLVLKISADGKTFAEEKTTFISPISGYVSEVHFREGDYVKKGEVIVRLQDREMELQLKKAEAERLKAMAKFIILYGSFSEIYGKNKKDGELEKRKKEYEKAIYLFKMGKIDRKKLDKIERDFFELMVKKGAMREEVQRIISGLTSAEIELERIRLLYERRFFKAPFSGYISELMVSPGERIEKGEAVFKMIDLSSMIVRANVLETEINKISKGEMVCIRFISYPDRVFYGRISGILPRLNDEGGTATCLISFKNPGYIYEGMNCNVEIFWKVVKNVVIVPKKAIVIRSGKPLLFVVKKNRAYWRYIKRGFENESVVEILEGVKPGEDVVIEGQLTLAHLSKVKIVGRK